MTALRKSYLPGETPSRRFLALVCLALFLALELFASFPALHRIIHSDADSSTHHCAITLFSQGNVNATDIAPRVIAFVAALLFYLPVLPSARSSQFDYRFSASRAPPAA
jgi:hypothetical protein